METKVNYAVQQVEQQGVATPQQSKRETLAKTLATPPPQGFVKEHPFVKGLKYTPIGIVEGLLDRLFGFGNWKIEVLDTKMFANSVVVVIRLHYRIDGEWLFHDGIGAAPLQVNAGAKPTDIDELKSNAVMIGLPAAKSFAIKDAAEHLGELFGRNLNRTSFIPSVKPENKGEQKVVKVELKNQNQNK
jgi:hypothetical protein